MKTVVIIEKGKDGTYSVYPDNHEISIIGEGTSVEEAKNDFMNSYHEIVEYYNVSKFAQWLGISPSLMRHYKSGDTYISANQAKKIEEGIHRLAARMLSITL